MTKTKEQMGKNKNEFRKCLLLETHNIWKLNCNEMVLNRMKYKHHVTDDSCQLHEQPKLLEKEKSYSH
jgi:hypothetical protein